MLIEPIRTASLGDTSFVVAHGGAGVVIDPQRDLRRFLEVIERMEIQVSHVLDTHVHNDYLSGAPALARRLKADLVMPAGSGAGFPFVAAFHHEDLKAEGGLTIRPIHTPGHTPEHTSYVILVDGVQAAVFTGGSLLAGSAGRTDLLGEEFAESLARLQYLSVNRIAELPGDVEVHPTHGAGSFCTASAAAGGGASTVAAELRSNPVLGYPDVETFVEGQLSGLLPYPDYYAHMAPINRRDPGEFESVVVPLTTATEIDPTAWIIDVRSRDRYFAGHLPGSLNIEWGSSFAPWVGWLVPFGNPVHLVLEPLQDPAWAVTELARIGYSVAGATIDLSNADLVSGRTATTDEAAAAVQEGKTVIDVRDPSEWESAHAEGTVHRYVPDLRKGVPGSDEVWLICASGFRAAIAAGIAERAGRSPVTVTAGGVPRLLKDHPDLRVD
ncbi:MAG: MBL fold metallo-hydrolase [Acidimicrobiia bacterium]|nr:MBL fold metallo-hydrolase [Acidimicrobiia bacterium]